METRTGFSLQRCAFDPHGDNGKDDVCLQFMSDQDYSLRAKSQIRKELLSGQAAKIGLSGWAAKIACMYVDNIYIYIYRERERLFALVRAHHPAHVCHAFCATVSCCISQSVECPLHWTQSSHSNSAPDPPCTHICTYRPSRSKDNFCAKFLRICITLRTIFGTHTTASRIIFGTHTATRNIFGTHTATP